MRHVPRFLATLTTLVVSVALLTVSGGPARAAERPDSLGKDFWLTFTKNYSQTPALSLFISAPRATTGTVSVPGLSFSQDFAVSPGAVATITLPANAQLTRGDSGIPENLGIHVTAADEVAVYGLNRIEFTTDAYMALPVDVLGTRYIVLGYPAQFSPSQFAVVAAHDGTEVTYVPTADTTSGVLTGTAKTVTLSQGDALPVSASSGDLSGTVITSTKPIAVLGGQECANVPSAGVGYCDYLVEQLPSTSTWGKSHLTVPLKTRTRGDTFRIVAGEDDTSVSLNGSPLATLNAGEVLQQIIEGQSSITSDKPILVSQFSNGATYDGSTSDPFMMLTIPTEQFMTEYTFTTPASGFSANFVNVVAPGSAVGNVQLDGAPVPASEFTPIGSTGFSGAQVSLSPGSHTMVSPEAFGIYVYGFATDDSYGYPGGAAYAPINDVRAIALTPPSQDAVVNSKACLTATVTDQDGKVLAGIEVNLQSTGANAVTTSGLTDSNGTFTYCYQSATIGSDTFVASFGSLSATASVRWVAVAPTPAPSPTPTPTPTAAPQPSKKKTLPIKVKDVKPPVVKAGADDAVVLVKGLRTNKKGRLAISTSCRPVGSGAAGEVRFCRATVSRSGKVTVRMTGYDTVRVTVRVRAVPKKGQQDEWRSDTWRRTWRVQG